MTLRRLILSRLMLVLLLIAPISLHADEPLVADLDNHLVAITAGFTGRDLLLFGSIRGEGEVVVVVHGPKEDVLVRRKDRVAGIWMNQDSVTFENTPSFYRVATSAPSGLNLPSSALRRHQIGVHNIRMRAVEDISDADLAIFSDALLRRKIAVGHYDERPGIVERRGGQLFRTTVTIPANVPVGTYTVETLLIRNGQVEAAQTTPLFVNKEGFGSQVYRTANIHPSLYGIIAIFIAGFTGLAANWIFQKL